MIKTTEALAPNEQTRLEQCELSIERGLNTFVEVGRALTEIRDSKLYRVGFKTFEDYCKQRWEIGKSRAYELIDQAKVVAAIESIGVNLSAAADFSKRDVRAVKDNLPAVSADVKARVEHGEEPAKAATAAVKEAAEKAKTEKAAKQAENDAARQQAQEALPPAVKAQQEARQAAIDAAKAKKSEAPPAGITDAERIAELEEQVTVLERDYTALLADYRKFEEMEALFKKGGFEAVIASKDEIIRVAETRIYGESQEKVRWMNSAKYWKKQALALGWKSNKGGESDPIGDAA
jgi:hypothetical protein